MYIGNQLKNLTNVMGTQYFSGNGVQVDFPLDRPIASVNDIDIVIENVPQNQELVFGLVNSQLIRFTSPPPTGTRNGYIRYRALNVSGVAPMQGSVTWESLATPLQSAMFGSYRNRIINPFTENQRALTSVGDDAYCLDRWYVLTETGNVTINQITDPESGAPSAIRLIQPDASAKRMGLATIIESKDIRGYRNMAMNLGMRVKPSFAGNVRYAVIEHTGTADVVTSDVVNNWASASFIPGGFFVSGINILKTGVVAPGAGLYGDLSDWSVLGASCNNVVLFVWTESAQAQNAYLELNRPQFEPGTIRTPQEWRHNELQLCQRYCFKAPQSSSQEIGIGPCQQNVYIKWYMQFPVTMRTTPTWSNAPTSFVSSLTSSGQAAAYNFSTSTTVSITGSLSTINQLSQQGGGLYLQASTNFNTSAGNIVGIATYDAPLLTAEL